MHPGHRFRVFFIWAIVFRLSQCNGKKEASVSGVRWETGSCFGSRKKAHECDAPLSAAGGGDTATTSTVATLHVIEQERGEVGPEKKHKCPQLAFLSTLFSLLHFYASQYTMQLVWLHPTHPLPPSHPPNFLPKKPGGPKDGRKGSADNMCERVFAGLRDHDFCDPVCV